MTDNRNLTRKGVFSPRFLARMREKVRARPAPKIPEARKSPKPQEGFELFITKPMVGRAGFERLLFAGAEIFSVKDVKDTSGTAEKASPLPPKP
jgi:hypothetical protein